MKRKLALSVGVGAALLLFTGVASAEPGVTQADIDFFKQLLDIVETFVGELKGLLDMQN